MVLIIPFSDSLMLEYLSLNLLTDILVKTLGGNSESIFSFVTSTSVITTTVTRYNWRSSVSDVQ